MSIPCPMLRLVGGRNRGEIPEIVILAAVRDGFEVFRIPTVGNANTCDLPLFSHTDCLLFFNNGVVRKLIACDPAAFFDQTDDPFCVGVWLGDLIQCLFDQFFSVHETTPFELVFACGRKIYNYIIERYRLTIQSHIAVASGTFPCYNQIYCGSLTGGTSMTKSASNYDLQVDIGKRIFLQYDQELLIRKFQLESDEQYIYLTYLNTPCRISRVSGGIEEYRKDAWKECRSYGTVMTIYDLLCYHKGADVPPLQGQWCAVGNFVVTGVTDTESFTKKYAARFDGRLDKLEAAAQRMGGILQPRMAGADLTCKFHVVPFFPVLLQFWGGDDEFPPKLMLLWDQNTGSFMHFETTFYLQGDLLERLRIHFSA